MYLTHGGAQVRAQVLLLVSHIPNITLNLYGARRVLARPTEMVGFLTPNSTHCTHPLLWRTIQSFPSCLWQKQ